jgi:hypothetical protein
MKNSNLPAPVLAKLLALEEAVEDLTQRVVKTHDGIEHARRRLTGGFRTPAEGDDLNASLKQLIADKPAVEMRLHAAKSVLSNCKAWLEALPPNTALEPVDVEPDGHNLADVRAKIKALEAELAALRAAPSADVEQRIRDYVLSMAKPTITGVGKGEKLKVIWPGAGWGPSGPYEHKAEVLPMLALLFPEQMTAALMAEIDTHSSDVCPDVLIKQIDQLAYVEEQLVAAAIADGADVERSPNALPQAVLQVMVAEATKSSRRAA